MSRTDALISALYRISRAALADAQCCCAGRNVVIKIGGAQINSMGHGFPDHPPTSSDAMLTIMYPYFEHCIKCFGARRCMFESNFPVDRGTIGYRSLWNCFKKTASKMGLNDQEKAEIFHDCAQRVYSVKGLGTGARL